MTREALIEAMARAIAREAGHDPDAMIPGATKEAGRIWRQFIGAATAALTAIEAAGAVVVPVEPTDDMSRASAIRINLSSPSSRLITWGVKAWTAMIKASPYRSAE